MNTDTEKQLRDRIAALEAENAGLLAFKASVARQTEMLNNGIWDVPKDGEPAGELYKAVTDLHDDAFGTARQRDQYQEDLARLTGTLTVY